MRGSRPHPGCGCVQAVPWRMARRRSGNSGGGVGMSGVGGTAHKGIRRSGGWSARGMGASVTVGAQGSMPGGSALLQVPALQQHVCGHGASTEESRQGGVGAGDGRDRPPVLRLPAQVGAHGLERSLDSPASQEPGHDRMGRALRAGTGQGNGCSDAGRAGSGASCWSVFQGLALAVVPAHADRPAVSAVRVGGPPGTGDAPSLSRSSRVRCPAAGVRRP